jgi:hypothetical protein
MRSLLLSGLLSEPVGSLKEQIRAWDDADIAIQASSAVIHSARRMLPSGAVRSIDKSISKAKTSFLRVGENEPELEFSDTDYPLMKFCRLCKHFGEAVDNVPTLSKLEYASLRIEQKFVETLNAHDERGTLERLRRSPRRGFAGSSVIDASRFVLTQVFKQLGAAFDRLPEADRLKVADAVLEQINALDPATQSIIRENLDIDRLSVDALLKSGALSSLGAGLGAAVAIGGFGSYTLLTSTMASVAGLVGVTLPFKAYIVAASGLAFLSNPLVLGVAAAGGGMFLRRQVNRQIQSKLAALQVALAIAARSSSSLPADASRAFVEQARLRHQEFQHAVGSSHRRYVAAFPMFEGA